MIIVVASALVLNYAGDFLVIFKSDFWSGIVWYSKSKCITTIPLFSLAIYVRGIVTRLPDSQLSAFLVNIVLIPGIGTIITILLFSVDVIKCLFEQENSTELQVRIALA